MPGRPPHGRRTADSSLSLSYCGSVCKPVRITVGCVEFSGKRGSSGAGLNGSSRDVSRPATSGGRDPRVRPRSARTFRNFIGPRSLVIKSAVALASGSGGCVVVGGQSAIVISLSELQ